MCPDLKFEPSRWDISFNIYIIKVVVKSCQVRLENSDNRPSPEGCMNFTLLLLKTLKTLISKDSPFLEKALSFGSLAPSANKHNLKHNHRVNEIYQTLFIPLLLMICLHLVKFSRFIKRTLHKSCLINTFSGHVMHNSWFSNSIGRQCALVSIQLYSIKRYLRPNLRSRMIIYY